MVKIIGIIVVIGSILAGFVLSGGSIMALVHPYEVLTIGGASLGAFLQANSGSTFKIVFKKSLSMFGHRFTHAYYLDVLKLLYEILNKSRREGMMSIEGDIEEPNESPIFSKYPAILKDARMTAFITDYLRLMSSGNMAPHELEGLFDMELNSTKADLEHPSHAVAKIADGMPAMGIVAAVLGIVITMGLLAEGDTIKIGASVGTALVGTFLGILASYGFFAPLAASLEHDAKEELNVLESIKATLVASASGMPPTVAVEFGRKVLYPAHRPSFIELEQAMRGA
ncbi:MULTISPECIES: flagellar motor stator protein MotA [Pseudomonas]|uniref:Flagellar motor protein MotA n=2 Tax=Pseudomonas TaxID=286 RepID=A0A2X2BZC5_PSELU|nr:MULTISPECIES: flagellar motor stator protein MotA [Pseudomonas]AYN95873.1 flagellar motor stator protein MotA [Pseudomonas sp. LTJR-52]ENA32999.1 flagellar motor stator protein MotA [Pseudomonas sp. HPB0071]MBA1248372.1 flagellar motor stator protein MotA [Pseudomonas zeshuii]MBF8639780.1 flagellar motor stator protein MotA [Pseudomonas zeshuii]MBW5411979.1 flagellar motor stator protein MotA [Pseudomonas sp. MAG002Y]